MGAFRFARAPGRGSGTRPRVAGPDGGARKAAGLKKGPANSRRAPVVGISDVQDLRFGLKLLGLWKDRFGLDQVVGVMPERFESPGSDARFWVPLAFCAAADHGA